MELQQEPLFGSPSTNALTASAALEVSRWKLSQPKTPGDGKMQEKQVPIPETGFSPQPAGYEGYEAAELWADGACASRKTRNSAHQRDDFKAVLSTKLSGEEAKCVYL